MHSSKTLRRTRMPRPLTAESSEEFEEPSSSQLAHENEQVSQKYMIQLDDLEIERENNKRDKEDEDYIESSQGSTSTQVTSGSMGDDDDDDSFRNEEGVATPTAGSQNGHSADIVKAEETFKNLSLHDIKIIKRFLEYIGYNRDQKTVAITVGWEIGDQQLQSIKTWIEHHGHEVDSWPSDL